MTDEIAALPPFLAEVARRFGVGTALRLARDLGGGRIKVPTTVTPRFAALIGHGALAKWLVAQYALADLDVPIGPYSSLRQKQQAFRAAIIESNGSASGIARAKGITIRTVRRYRAQGRSDPPPLPLFPELDRNKG